MKYTWEQSDIVGHHGRTGIVVAFKQFSDEETERWMIGYRVAPEGNQYSFISLRDGMVDEIGNIGKMIERLNTGKAVPLLHLHNAQAYVIEGSKLGV